MARVRCRMAICPQAFVATLVHGPCAGRSPGSRRVSRSMYFPAFMQQGALPLAQVLRAKPSKALRGPAVEHPGEVCSPAGSVTKPCASQGTVWEVLPWFVAL